MDIRTVSQEEKDRYINNVLETFSDLRNMLNTLEVDMQNDDLMIQASSVWISGQLVNWYYDFMKQIREIEKQKDDIQQKVKDAAHEKEDDKD